jgi:hypothetical protein
VKKESLTVMMMMKEKTRLASTWCSTQPPMTKHSVAAPRDLSFVIKTNSFNVLCKSKTIVGRLVLRPTRLMYKYTVGVV